MFHNACTKAIRELACSPTFAGRPQGPRPDPTEIRVPQIPDRTAEHDQRDAVRIPHCLAPLHAFSPTKAARQQRRSPKYPTREKARLSLPSPTRTMPVLSIENPL